MKDTVVIYGSSSGNTKNVAKSIAEILDADLVDISSASNEAFTGHSKIVVGTSTWGYGDLQDDWDSFLPKISKMDLKGKKVAFFGLGDAEMYPDTFVDGMGILYDAFTAAGAEAIGAWSKDGYSHQESKAERDGKFVGLAIDEDNQSDMTSNRIKVWTDSIKG